MLLFIPYLFNCMFSFYSSRYDLYLVIEEVTERKPVVDLSEELAHVGRVFRLHLPLEAVHLVHVLAGRRNKVIIRCSVSWLL